MTYCKQDQQQTIYFWKFHEIKINHAPPQASLRRGRASLNGSGDILNAVINMRSFLVGQARLFNEVNNKWWFRRKCIAQQGVNICRNNFQYIHLFRNKS